MDEEVEPAELVSVVPGGGGGGHEHHLLGQLTQSETTPSNLGTGRLRSSS